MRRKLAMIADGRLDGTRLHDLVELQDDAVKRAATAPELSALDSSDAEDVLTDWLDEHDFVDGWELASTLVAAGIDTDWLEQVAAGGRCGEPRSGGPVADLHAWRPSS